MSSEALESRVESLESERLVVDEVRKYYLTEFKHVNSQIESVRVELKYLRETHAEELRGLRETHAEELKGLRETHAAMVGCQLEW